MSDEQFCKPRVGTVDCDCGHNGDDHREEVDTGAARECHLCNCEQFYNVHMVRDALFLKTRQLKRLLNEVLEAAQAADGYIGTNGQLQKKIHDALKRE